MWYNKCHTMCAGPHHHPAGIDVVCLVKRAIYVQSQTPPGPSFVSSKPSAPATTSPSPSSPAKNSSYREQDPVERSHAQAERLLSFRPRAYTSREQGIYVYQHHIAYTQDSINRAARHLNRQNHAPGPDPGACIQYSRETRSRHTTERLPEQTTRSLSSTNPCKVRIEEVTMPKERREKEKPLLHQPSTRADRMEDSSGAENAR